ncbi:MAG: hypothetical protein CVV02_17375 [Firmicutes bacterium HGW-Firmicutes-7]|nr:MAG: hypothetical protein CVV02_17375 [Firmicutes bacterium HGW-Firmicutes-7]
MKPIKAKVAEIRPDSSSRRYLFCLLKLHGEGGAVGGSDSVNRRVSRHKKDRCECIYCFLVVKRNGKYTYFLPEGINLCENIAEGGMHLNGAFQMCRKLTGLMLPRSIAMIDS